MFWYKSYILTRDLAEANQGTLKMQSREWGRKIYTVSGAKELAGSESNHTHPKYTSI